MSFIRPPLTWWSECCTVVILSSHSELYSEVVGAPLSVLVVVSGTFATGLSGGLRGAVPSSLGYAQPPCLAPMSRVPLSIGLSGGLRDVLPSSLGCAQPPCLVPVLRVSISPPSRSVRPHLVLLWPPFGLLLLSPLPRPGSCSVQASLAHPVVLGVGLSTIANL